VDRFINFASLAGFSVRCFAAAIAVGTVAALVAVHPAVSFGAAAETEQTPQQRKLFLEGARLWPIYCAQCHNARPGSQFSPTQWDIITMHMRTQSIMPARDLRAIREFLKEAR
jgi:mono/diheme cytochrome c family protein